MGKMADVIQKDIYGSVQSKEIWQVFARKEVTLNSVVFPKLTNISKFSDFGCIIKNLSNNKRKFLLFLLIT
jgi:hypothetical protein